MKYPDYREQRSHGTLAFPCQYYNVTRTHPRYYASFHWHPETELIRVLSGRVHVNTDTAKYELHPGELLLIGGGILHSYAPEDNCEYECIVFDMDFLSGAADICRSYFRSQSMIDPFFTKNDTEIVQAAYGAFDAMRAERAGYELLTAGFLCTFFAKIIENGRYNQIVTLSSSQRKRLSAFKNVLSYIEGHYGSEISLDDLAGVADMNPNYFCRFFKNMTGKTPIDYLNYYRIEKACAELAEGSKTVAEIAERCGYNDCGYFIKVFKRYKGVTPSRYLK